MDTICTRCLRQAARSTLPSDVLRTAQCSRLLSSTAHRQFATPINAQTATATNPRPNDRPAATSTSTAQPFSAALTPNPANEHLPIQPDQTKQAARVQSSVPAGTVLKGLNFIKGKQDPIALEDSEYPSWLWSVLDKTDAAGGAAAADDGDLFSKSKKQRRRAAKALRKQQMMNPEAMGPKIPIYEQSIDLPSGDGTIQGAREARQARSDLTDAMRDHRRKKIKEDNFLRAMR